MTFTLLEILALVGLPAAPRSQAEGVVRGTVAYRERIALPQDAVVEVKLLDVSRQDVAAAVLSETRIATGGKQVPIPFELPYDPAKIDERATYAVRATIEAGGTMMFTTDRAYSVITRGNPAEANLMLVSARASEGGLWGTTWKLEDLGGGEVLPGVEATLEFVEEGRVAGKGSCNRFTGLVTIEGGSISFGNLAATAMACPEPIGKQEASYFQALRNAERFTLEGRTLSIFSKGAEKPLRFARAQ
jgi:putative lipoprotein